MKFTLYKDLLTQDGKGNTWLDAGTYDVVRLFDGNRVLIQVGINDQERQLTIVGIHKGQLNTA